VRALFSVGIVAVLSIQAAGQQVTINAGGVVNAASYTDMVAPGSIVSVFGSFGPGASALRIPGRSLPVRMARPARLSQ
jgi:hypothetical protein